MIKHTNGHLEEYHRKIMSGEIVAGVEMKMCVQRCIDLMDDPRYIYDTKDADKRIDFMQGCIRLTKSPFYGKPMILMLWQKAFISAVYGFKVAETGFDLFNRIVLLIARKNTKSETCSALGLSELILGPDGADIVCSSNDESQANILYEAIDVMRMMIDPEQRDTWRNQRGIKNLVNGSKIFKLSDRTRNKEGRNIDFAVIDEVHEMKTNVILKSIEQSQSLKDNPKLIIITTEGFVNEGVLDELLIECRRIINGEDDGISAEKTLPWLYTQDSEAEVWQDERSWMKSNPSLGTVKKWDYLRGQIDQAKKSKSTRMFVLSKDFNFKQSNSQAWLLPEDYGYSAAFDIDDFRNTLTLGAVDLAETTDLCSAKAILMKPGDKTKYVLSHYWIPESKLNASDDKTAGSQYAQWARDGYLTICEGNEVDVALLADWYLKLYRDYGIRLYKCGYDQRFAKTFLSRMDDYGFECEMVLQNRFVMSQPMKLVEADFKDQYINYNENPIDKWCFGNASMEIDGLGNVMCVKINNQAARRIDGAVSLIIAYEIFRRYRTEFIQGIS